MPHPSGRRRPFATTSLTSVPHGKLSHCFLKGSRGILLLFTSYAEQGIKPATYGIAANASNHYTTTSTIFILAFPISHWDAPCWYWASPKRFQSFPTKNWYPYTVISHCFLLVLEITIFQKLPQSYQSICGCNSQTFHKLLSLFLTVTNWISKLHIILISAVEVTNNYLCR